MKIGRSRLLRLVSRGNQSLAAYTQISVNIPAVKLKKRFRDMSAILEFLEFIEQPGNQSVRELLDRVLMKAREMTGAEAGSIFIVRKSGKQDWLVANSIQND